MGTPAEQTAVRQALLAQTLVTAVELPETQRLVVAGPDPAWGPPAGAAAMVVEALTGGPLGRAHHPWPQALAREPSTLPRVLVSRRRSSEALELPAAHVAEVRAQYRDVRDYEAVVDRSGRHPRGDPHRPHPPARRLVPRPIPTHAPS